MHIRNKIENSKTLLFTSLVAVALLGATQPVSAETYTSRNFDWSGDDWPEDDWSGDGLSKYDRSGVGLSQYGWAKYGWCCDKEEWPEDDWSEDDWSNDYWSKYSWSSDKEEWPEDWPEDDWSSDKKDETEDKTRPPYEGLGTGYEKRDDWGGPGTVATDPYTPPYEGALGTGYEGSDWKGPGHISQPNQHQQSPNPSQIPKPPHSEWPPSVFPENSDWEQSPNPSQIPKPPHSEWPPSIFPENSDWGRSEETPHSPSESGIPESNISPSPGQLPPQENPQVSDYERGLSDGLKAKRLGQGPDFVNLKNNDWSEGYKKGYMAAFSTP
ncbi:lysis inhibitor protein [Streptococcus pyogenes]|uniref:lysis inhibitor protein n=1 Tax=Streptococcus pyogenes TaxID=1314 RepID=UPI0010A10C56|nr:lysis inhibitor protein [Streptococcus pyogenes]VHB28911.1 sic family protein [Streptococcus pyogenes]